MLDSLLVLAGLALAVITWVLAYTVFAIRSGVGKGVEPRGFRGLDWSQAWALTWDQAGRLAVAIGLSLVPGLGHLMLGRVARALPWLVAGLGIHAILLANEPADGDGSPVGLLAIVLIGLVFFAARDTYRLAMADLLVDAGDRIEREFAAAERHLPSCPRCRVNSRGVGAFCMPCANVLAAQPVAVDAPVVRAAVDDARHKEPALKSLRHDRIIRGRFVGDAMRMPQSTEPSVDKTLAKALLDYRTDVRGAWLDPADPRCLWIWADGDGKTADGRRLLSSGVLLAAYTDGRLASVWAFKPFRWVHAAIDADCGVPGAAAQPASHAA